MTLEFGVMRKFPPLRDSIDVWSTGGESDIMIPLSVVSADLASS